MSYRPKCKHCGRDLDNKSPHRSCSVCTKVWDAAHESGYKKGRAEALESFRVDLRTMLGYYEQER